MTEIEPRTPAPTVLRLGEPEDLLSAIPYLLKFHPEKSLVFLLLSGRRLVLTARLGIDPDRGEPEASTVAAYLRQLCADHGADGLLLVGYFPDAEWAGSLVVDVLSWLDPLPVHTALVTDGHRWWSCLCDHEDWEPCDCNAAEGTPYDVTTTAVAAEAVLAGLSVLPNRETLARSVRGPADEEARRAATAAFEDVLQEICELSDEQRRDRMALLVEQHCLGHEPLTDREYAELAVLAYDGPVRDVAVGRMGQEDAHAHVELWHGVVARTVAPFESAPLCLLGLAAWISGNGALQVVCMERAERINPDYSLLQILDQINARALPPSAWSELRAA